MGLSSCATGTKVESPPISLNRLEKLVLKNLPGGMRKRSANGRDYYSNYFNPQSLRSDAKSIDPVRAKAQISLLGERRPYTINVYVMTEQKLADGTFVEVGRDPQAEQRIAEGLEMDLDESRKDRNVVDDFRPF